MSICGLELGGFTKWSVLRQLVSSVNKMDLNLMGSQMSVIGASSKCVKCGLELEGLLNGSSQRGKYVLPVGAGAICTGSCGIELEGLLIGQNLDSW